jgi:SAM-dependent methyltransferase
MVAARLPRPQAVDEIGEAHLAGAAQAFGGDDRLSPRSTSDVDRGGDAPADQARREVHARGKSRVWSRVAQPWERPTPGMQSTYRGILTSGRGPLYNNVHHISKPATRRSPRQRCRILLRRQRVSMIGDRKILDAAATTVSEGPPLATLFARRADLFVCPVSGEPLVVTGAGLRAQATGRLYPIEEGIPRFYVPPEPSSDGREVTDLVRAFYEANPFPNYNDEDTAQTLAARGHANLLISVLDAQLAPGAVVLEAGCGTGQLTNFLGLAGQRTVFGGDICLNSLRLADGFRQQQGIENVGFLQMDLFRPPFRDDSFDMVISSGVLHHTSNARAGFEALLRKVKPGGLILIGLYNYYARLTTLLRGRVFARFGKAAYFLDRRLIAGRYNEARWQAWFRDQYQHPHETRHSIDEVLAWFDESGVVFLSSIPRADGGSFTRNTPLFEPQSQGSRVRRLAVQLRLLARGAPDGFFIMIGRKRDSR